MDLDEEGEETNQDFPLLHHLCNDVGFSYKQWKYRLWINDVSNTVHGFRSLIGYSALRIHSGSSADGVGANFLGSDIDVMWLPITIRVIKGHSVLTDEKNHVFKLVPTEHPAYYRLMLVHIGHSKEFPADLMMSFCEKDEAGRIFLRNDRIKQQRYTDTTINGPALTSNISDDMEIDFVTTLNCDFWPHASLEWFKRRRYYNWPSQEMINYISRNGSEVVAVGNCSSITPHLEWRLSSSLAEKLLIRSFNTCQMQCYFLLKLVLVFLIKTSLPHTLCSYHMKTLILHVVEKSDPVEWTEKNLASCFMKCLQFLITCIEQANLPQYFITSHNLFDPKIQGESRIKLLKIVKDLQSEGWKCVLKCPPFNNAYTLCQHLEPRCPCHITFWKAQLEKQRMQVAACLSSFYKIVCDVFEDLISPDINGTVERLLQCQNERWKELKLYFPCQDTLVKLQLYLKNITGYCLLAVINDRKKGSQELSKSICEYARNILEESCSTDVTSCRLKLATFYYQTGDKHSCLKVVKDVCKEITDNTLPLCLDNLSLLEIDNVQYSKKLHYVITLDNDVNTLLRNVALPVMFSRWDIAYSPPAIGYLMDSRLLRAKHDQHYNNLLFIDPQVYIYYLMIICNEDLGNSVKSSLILLFMSQVVRNPRQFCLYYPDVARLLLDYCIDYGKPSMWQNVKRLIMVFLKGTLKLIKWISDVFRYL